MPTPMVSPPDEGWGYVNVSGQERLACPTCRTTPGGVPSPAAR